MTSENGRRKVKSIWFKNVNSLFFPPHIGLTVYQTKSSLATIINGKTTKRAVSAFQPYHNHYPITFPMVESFR
jgi:hypothetical protein